MRILSVKLEYLKAGTIFSQMACVKIHQTFAATAYIKTSQLGDHRLSSCRRSQPAVAYAEWLIIYNDNNKSKHIRERKGRYIVLNVRKRQMASPNCENESEDVGVDRSSR